MELYQHSIVELREIFKTNQATPSDAVQALIERIEKVDSLIGGYLGYEPEKALAEAKKADVSLPLGGVPVAIKDLINIEGQPCTAGSRILQNYTALYDATVIRKLREAGAIPFGRTNMDEFGMGGSTERSALQITRNPWDTTRAPGGSSGGSAAVIGAQEAFGALGSDSGGSIRQPAAFCGCVGLKPTYGRVSRFGVIGFASSLDQIGPMTKNIADSALILQAISGADNQDPTAWQDPIPDFSKLLGHDIKGVRMGIPKEYFSMEIDAQIKESVQKAIQQMESLGAEIIEVSLPNAEYVTTVYSIISSAEASTNLARFDGVRYGRRSAQTTDATNIYELSRGEGFGDEVKRRIFFGGFVLTRDCYEAIYVKAQKVRTLIRLDFQNAFKKVDVLISPTTPTLAFKLGEYDGNPHQMAVSDTLVNAANLVGTCAISLPCGFATESGKQLPIGLQLIGKPFDEANLLRIAYAYEQSTDWHKSFAQL